MTETDRPLTGVRVLDLTRVLAGPAATRILADLGADVIKVEPPRGDLTRGVQPFRAGISVYYAQANASKRNVSIDLAQPEASELVARLAERCDALVENFRPGVLARRGLDAPTLLARNPRLIFCSVSGYGQDGLWATRRAYAPLVHGEAGTLELAARKRRAPLAPEVQSHGDVYAATMAANAVLAALVRRERTGRGQHLDVSMAEVLVYTNEWAAAELEGNDAPQLFGSWNGAILKLSDGRSVAFAGNVAFTFPTWARAMGREEFLRDERLATPEQREGHRELVLAILQEYVGGFECVEKLEQALEPSGIAVGSVRSLEDVAETEWAHHRGLLGETPEGIRLPRAPWRAAGSLPPPPARVAARGADNAAVLRELLGLADAELERLTRVGVLSAADAEEDEDG